MFLIDKYYYDSNFLLCYKTLIEKILKSFDRHKIIYDNAKEIIKLPNEEFKNIIYNLNYETYRYANFQHLIVYGTNGSCKEYLINKLLEQIYGKSNIELHEVEYIVSGYSNTKTKITVKQSKYHIFIEPNYNGFDKYIIQEIIYELLKILDHDFINQWDVDVFNKSVTQRFDDFTDFVKIHYCLSLIKCWY